MRRPTGSRVQADTGASRILSTNAKRRGSYLSDLVPLLKGNQPGTSRGHTGELESPVHWSSLRPPFAQASGGGLAEATKMSGQPACFPHPSTRLRLPEVIFLLKKPWNSLREYPRGPHPIVGTPREGRNPRPGRADPPRRKITIVAPESTPTRSDQALGTPRGLARPSASHPTTAVPVPSVAADLAPHLEGPPP